MSGRSALPAGVSQAGQSGERAFAPLHGKDDRAEPGADDQALKGQREGAGGGLPPLAAFSTAAWRLRWWPTNEKQKRCTP